MSNDQSTDATEVDALLPKIEAALALYSVSQTAFGYAAVGDPALIGRMRKGNLIRKVARREKIEGALRRLEKEGRL